MSGFTVENFKAAGSRIHEIRAGVDDRPYQI